MIILLYQYHNLQINYEYHFKFSSNQFEKDKPNKEFIL